MQNVVYNISFFKFQVIETLLSEHQIQNKRS